MLCRAYVIGNWITSRKETYLVFITRIHAEVISFACGWKVSWNMNADLNFSFYCERSNGLEEFPSIIFFCLRGKNLLRRAKEKEIHLEALFLTSYEHLCQVYCIRFVFIDNVPSDLLRLQSCRKVIHNGPEKIVTKYHTSDLYANCVLEGTVSDLSFSG